MIQAGVPLWIILEWLAFCWVTSCSKPHNPSIWSPSDCVRGQSGCLTGIFTDSVLRVCESLSFIFSGPAIRTISFMLWIHGICQIRGAGFASRKKTRGDVFSAESGHLTAKGASYTRYTPRDVDRDSPSIRILPTALLTGRQCCCSFWSLEGPNLREGCGAEFRPERSPCQFQTNL